MQYGEEPGSVTEVPKQARHYGIQFLPVDGPTLETALARAADIHADRHTWRAMQRQGMKAELSWTRSAGAYARLYRRLALREQT